MHVRSMGVRFGLLTTLTLATFAPSPSSARDDVAIGGKLVKVREYEICRKRDQRKPPDCLDIVAGGQQIQVTSSCPGLANLHALIVTHTGGEKTERLRSIVSTLATGESITLKLTDVIPADVLRNVKGVRWNTRFGKVFRCRGEPHYRKTKD